ncbi:unnamed protein product, partial [Meganyctiphanes norvegica]
MTDLLGLRSPSFPLQVMHRSIQVNVKNVIRTPIINVLVISVMCVCHLYLVVDKGILNSCCMILTVTSVKRSLLVDQAVRALRFTGKGIHFDGDFLVLKSNCRRKSGGIGKYSYLKRDPESREINNLRRFFMKPFQSLKISFNNGMRQRSRKVMGTVRFGTSFFLLILSSMNVLFHTKKTMSSSPINVILTPGSVTGAMCSDEEGDSSHCVVKLSSPLLLPRGFEGELMLQKSTKSDINLCGQNFSMKGNSTKTLECAWESQGVIKYTYVGDTHGIISPWKNKSCPLISAHYHISAERPIVDRKTLVLQLKREGKLVMILVNSKLFMEEQQFGDIVYMPMIDVYNNLPQKVLAFLNWVTLSFCSAYILKVDDDVHVNLARIKELIEPSPPATSTWWSHFHYQRSVPLMGKWADPHYPGIAYPYFPSGSGYLMTYSLAASISVASEYLDAGRGEDVSMGIWVAALAPRTHRVHVPCWLPSSGCSYSVITTSLEAIKPRVWTHQGETQSTLPKKEL